MIPFADQRKIHGSELERTKSLELHNMPNGVPLLISEKLLRNVGMGQVDLAMVLPDKVIIWEVKQDHDFLTTRQWKRLQSTQDFLGKLFERACILKIV